MSAPGSAGPPTDGAIRAPAVLEELRRDEEELRPEARASFGVTGAFAYGPLRDLPRASEVGWRPLTALCLLGVVEAFQLFGLVLVGTRVELTIGGGSPSWLVRLLVLSVAVVPLLAVVDRHGGRAVLAVVGPHVAAFGLLSAALGGVQVGVALAAVGSAAVQAVHRPLLWDLYRPEFRVRVFSIYTGTFLGGIGSAALLVLLADSAGLTWRSALLAMGVVAFLFTLLAVRLRDPGIGRWDVASVIRLVRGRLGEPGRHRAKLTERQVDLGPLEKLRRASASAPARAMIGLGAAFGLFLIPFHHYLFLFLRDRWDLTWQGRVGVFALLCFVALAGLALIARRGEVVYRAGLARLAQLAAWACTLSGAAIAVAIVVPSLLLAVLLLALAVSSLAFVWVGAGVVLLSVVDPYLRSYAAAAQWFAALTGGLLSQVVMESIGSRFGIYWALLSGSVILLLLAGQAARVIHTVDAELDRTVDRLVEQEELRTLRSQGRLLPLLTCRNIDFSYGRLQVLFDVSFTVDEGEMVALLGTNGAGKSTLLRVISGLGYPDRGSVHYRGSDITYLDADRRVRLGISQVPGGRAVFGPLSVVENLRAFGYTHGRDQAAVDRGIEESFAIFPNLAERRNQPSSTLSGGEQQMLGLAKAFVLEPRLLLIDELSLGLAPVVVSQLLEMVQQLNARGVAIVLVEQSVNVALSLVHHAYFMEKGEVRFDGKAEELLARPDLLRSVFLAGASGGMTSRVAEPEG